MRRLDEIEARLKTWRKGPDCPGHAVLLVQLTARMPCACSANQCRCGVSDEDGNYPWCGFDTKWDRYSACAPCRVRAEIEKEEQ